MVAAMVALIKIQVKMFIRLLFFYSVFLILVVPFRGKTDFYLLCMFTIDIPHIAYSVPLSSFYAYNTSNGDSLLEKDDDNTAHINLSTPFFFYNQSYNGLYVRYNCMK